MILIIWQWSYYYCIKCIKANAELGYGNVKALMCNRRIKNWTFELICIFQQLTFIFYAPFLCIASLTTFSFFPIHFPIFFIFYYFFIKKYCCCCFLHLSVWFFFFLWMGSILLKEKGRRNNNFLCNSKAVKFLFC